MDHALSVVSKVTATPNTWVLLSPGGGRRPGNLCISTENRGLAAPARPQQRVTGVGAAVRAEAGLRLHASLCLYPPMAVHFSGSGFVSSACRLAREHESCLYTDTNTHILVTMASTQAPSLAITALWRVLGRPGTAHKPCLL